MNQTDLPSEPRETEQLDLSLQALYGLLLSDERLEVTLRRVAELAAETLPTCDLADITLVRDGKPVTKGATDGRAQMVDEVQYGSGQGPCLDAWRHGEVVHVPSVLEDTRWPQFSSAAARAGILSTMAVPLEVRGNLIGALNLHALREHAFTDHDDQVATLFAQQASVALANAQTHDAAVALAENLREAMATRAPIEQAKGVLMARHHCSPDDAFEMLVKRSQHENRKLRLVAEDLVRGARLT